MVIAEQCSPLQTSFERIVYVAITEQRVDYPMGFRMKRMQNLISQGEAHIVAILTRQPHLSLVGVIDRFACLRSDMLDVLSSDFQR